MSRILLVSDDTSLYAPMQAALSGEGHIMRYAPDGRPALAMLAEESIDLVITNLTMPVVDGFELLERLRRDHCDLKCLVLTEHETPDAVIGALRKHICDFLTKPFTDSELRDAVNSALGECSAARIEVISARPEWVELSVPCGLDAVSPLLKLLTELEADLPQDMREAVTDAFREMLNNAIEHGCKLDQAKRVEVGYVRFNRAILCRIKDPGKGFDPARLEHAATSNPSDDPFRHVLVREEKGLRPGGFGILMTNQIVDELAYNERHNELMFIKYLS